MYDNHNYISICEIMNAVIIIPGPEAPQWERLYLPGIRSFG